MYVAWLFLQNVLDLVLDYKRMNFFLEKTKPYSISCYHLNIKADKTVDELWKDIYQSHCLQVMFFHHLFFKKFNNSRHSFTNKTGREYLKHGKNIKIINYIHSEVDYSEDDTDQVPSNFVKMSYLLVFCIQLSD